MNSIDINTIRTLNPAHIDVQPNFLQNSVDFSSVNNSTLFFSSLLLIWILYNL